MNKIFLLIRTVLVICSLLVFVDNNLTKIKVWLSYEGYVEAVIPKVSELVIHS